MPNGQMPIYGQNGQPTPHRMMQPGMNPQQQWGMRQYGPQGQYGTQGQYRPGMHGQFRPEGVDSGQNNKGQVGSNNSEMSNGSHGQQNPQMQMRPEGPSGPDGHQGMQRLVGNNGPPGPYGQQRPVGSYGPQMPYGQMGPGGPQGSMPPRPDGLQGMQGNYGMQRPIGPDGMHRPIRPQGPYVPQRQMGPGGLQRPMGPESMQRPMGPDGMQRPMGPDGMQRPMGPDGMQRPIGPDGMQRPMGPDGMQRPMGPDGMQRPIGPDGMQRPMGPDGMQRPMGPDGMQRPVGHDGIQRPLGPDGIQRPMGPDGMQRPMGPDGMQRPMGPGSMHRPMGPDGMQRPIGPDGMQRSMGPDGMQRPMGPESMQRPMGPDGMQQAMGPDGMQRPMGPDGMQRPMGPDGMQRPMGPDGMQRPMGPDGMQRSMGPDGMQRPMGPDGMQRPMGPDGMQRPMGPDGMQRPMGPDGMQRPMGPDGMQRPMGPDGMQRPMGPDGMQRPMGPDGMQRPMGTDGMQRPMGPDGMQRPMGPDGMQRPMGPDGMQRPMRPGGMHRPMGPDGMQRPMGPESMQRPMGPDGIQRPVYPGGPHMPYGIRQGMLQGMQNMTPHGQVRPQEMQEPMGAQNANNTQGQIAQNGQPKEPEKQLKDNQTKDQDGKEEQNSDQEDEDSVKSEQPENTDGQTVAPVPPSGETSTKNKDDPELSNTQQQNKSTEGSGSPPMPYGQQHPHGKHPGWNGPYNQNYPMQNNPKYPMRPGMMPHEQQYAARTGMPGNPNSQYRHQDPSGSIRMPGGNHEWPPSMPQPQDQSQPLPGNLAKKEQPTGQPGSSLPPQNNMTEDSDDDLSGQTTPATTPVKSTTAGTSPGQKAEILPHLYNSNHPRSFRNSYWRAKTTVTNVQQGPQLAVPQMPGAPGSIQCFGQAESSGDQVKIEDKSGTDIPEGEQKNATDGGSASRLELLPIDQTPMAVTSVTMSSLSGGTIPSVYPRQQSEAMPQGQYQPEQYMRGPRPQMGYPMSGHNTGMHRGMPQMMAQNMQQPGMPPQAMNDFRANYGPRANYIRHPNPGPRPDMVASHPFLGALSRMEPASQFRTPSQMKESGKAEDKDLSSTKGQTNQNKDSNAVVTNKENINDLEDHEKEAKQSEPGSDFEESEKGETGTKVTKKQAEIDNPKEVTKEGEDMGSQSVNKGNTQHSQLSYHMQQGPHVMNQAQGPYPGVQHGPRGYGQGPHGHVPYGPSHHSHPGPEYSGMPRAGGPFGQHGYRPEGSYMQYRPNGPMGSGLHTNYPSGPNQGMAGPNRPQFNDPSQMQSMNPMQEQSQDGLETQKGGKPMEKKPPYESYPQGQYQHRPPWPHPPQNSSGDGTPYGRYPGPNKFPSSMPPGNREGEMNSSNLEITKQEQKQQSEKPSSQIGLSAGDSNGTPPPPQQTPTSSEESETVIADTKEKVSEHNSLESTSNMNENTESDKTETNADAQRKDKSSTIAHNPASVEALQPEEVSRIGPEKERHWSGSSKGTPDDFQKKPDEVQIQQQSAKQTDQMNVPERYNSSRMVEDPSRSGPDGSKNRPEGQSLGPPQMMHMQRYPGQLPQFYGQPMPGGPMYGNDMQNAQRFPAQMSNTSMPGIHRPGFPANNLGHPSHSMMQGPSRSPIPQNPNRDQLQQELPQSNRQDTEMTSAGQMLKPVSSDLEEKSREASERLPVNDELRSTKDGSEQEKDNPPLMRESYSSLPMKKRKQESPDPIQAKIWRPGVEEKRPFDKASGSAAVSPKPDMSLQGRAPLVSQTLGEFEKSSVNGNAVSEIRSYSEEQPVPPREVEKVSAMDVDPLRSSPTGSLQMLGILPRVEPLRAVSVTPPDSPKQLLDLDQLKPSRPNPSALPNFSQPRAPSPSSNLLDLDRYGSRFPSPGMQHQTAPNPQQKSLMDLDSMARSGQMMPGYGQSQYMKHPSQGAMGPSSMMSHYGAAGGAGYPHPGLNPAITRDPSMMIHNAQVS